MSFFHEQTIEANGVESLVWDGDCVIDWAAGGHRYHIDGSIDRRSIYYAYSFDAAVTSPSGKYSVIYARTETKALLLQDGGIVRQLNRDFYQAKAYEYPITFAQLADGREVLIHCPESYCQLEIEEVETGKRLTGHRDRDAKDYFHSRLQVSPDGKWLMSRGWVWHPFSLVTIFDIEKAILDPKSLDEPTETAPSSWDLATAAFLNQETLIVGSMDEFIGEEDSRPKDKPECGSIATWEIGREQFSRMCHIMDKPIGEMMPINEDHVVAFYEHPRVLNLQSGKVVHEWTHIDSGTQVCSIIWDKLPPPIAIDSQNTRFAVGSDQAVHIVQIDAESL